MIRTKYLLSMCALGAVLATVLPLTTQAAILFSDTFDRSIDQMDDIDATTAGITANFSLPSIVYVERDEILAPLNSATITPEETAALTHIANNQLHLAYGPNASVVHVNHNFVGAGITGLKASLDIVSNDGTTDAIDRWVGIGFGGTQAEAEAAQYDFGSTAENPSWKGVQTGAVPGSGFADLFVAWERKANTDDNMGRVTLFSNGTRLAFYENDGAFYTQGGTLEVELAFADFNAGTTVTANITYAGSFVVSQDFTWDNTDANYIGITARQNNNGWTVDNLLIETVEIPEPSSLALSALMVVALGMGNRKRGI